MRVSMSVRIVVMAKKILPQRRKDAKVNQIHLCAFAPLREKYLLILRGARPLSFSSWLGASNVQVVVIQRRIEQQEKLTLRLVPPHRVRRKHHDVPAPNRNINNRRTVRQLTAARQHAADEQVLFIRRKTQHHAR